MRDRDGGVDRVRGGVPPWTCPRACPGGTPPPYPVHPAVPVPHSPARLVRTALWAQSGEACTGKQGCREAGKQGEAGEQRKTAENSGKHLKAAEKSGKKRTAGNSGNS